MCLFLLQGGRGGSLSLIAYIDTLQLREREGDGKSLKSNLKHMHNLPYAK